MTYLCFCGCPYDHVIFLMLREALADGIDIVPPLTNLRGGLVHLWDTDQMFPGETETTFHGVIAALICH
jgi:hypothetical protein